MSNALMVLIAWSPLSGSAPSKLLHCIANSMTELIVRMPLSGIVPLKTFLYIKNFLTWRPLPGSAPSKLFL
eukprot:6447261-Amphidinium_carterae.1